MFIKFVFIKVYALINVLTQYHNETLKFVAECIDDSLFPSFLKSLQIVRLPGG